MFPQNREKYFIFQNASLDYDYVMDVDDATHKEGHDGYVSVN